MVVESLGHKGFQNYFNKSNGLTGIKRTFGCHHAPLWQILLDDACAYSPDEILQAQPPSPLTAIRFRAYTKMGNRSENAPF